MTRPAYAMNLKDQRRRAELEHVCLCGITAGHHLVQIDESDPTRPFFRIVCPDDSGYYRNAVPLRWETRLL